MIQGAPPSETTGSKEIVHMSEKFTLIWPPPPQSNPNFSPFGDAFYIAPPLPVPTQSPGEWICPVQGCIGPVFKFTHGNPPHTPACIQCNICSGGIPYNPETIHELILLNSPDVKYKYCPNACCGHPTRQPKAAMEHPSMAHFSMGTYCRGCGAMWTRKEYIDDPKPKPWLADAPKMNPIVVAGPAPSAPPPESDTGVQWVKPEIYDHGVIPDQICAGRELQTQHNMLRVLCSIDRMMKRQEGLLQTIVGQRLARIEDSLDGISQNASAIQDTLQDPNLEQDIKAIKDNMSQVCYILRKAVYKEDNVDGPNDPYNYEGALRTFNVNS